MLIVNNLDQSGMPTAGSLYHGNVFIFEGKCYMKIRAENALISIKCSPDAITAVNLKTGTVREVRKNQCVRHVQGTCTVEDMPLSGRNTSETFSDKIDENEPQLDVDDPDADFMNELRKIS
jgi:hypothetical protein